MKQKPAAIHNSFLKTKKKIGQDWTFFPEESHPKSSKKEMDFKRLKNH